VSKKELTSSFPKAVRHRSRSNSRRHRHPSSKADRATGLWRAAVLAALRAAAMALHRRGFRMCAFAVSLVADGVVKQQPPAPAPAPAAAPQGPESRIYVTGLPKGTTEDALASHFGVIGQIGPSSTRTRARTHARTHAR